MLRERSPRLRAVRRLAFAGALAALALLATASVALGADPDSMFGAPFDSSATLAMTAATPRSLPSGFTDTAVWTGLTLPTAIRWAPDGRVFVALKSGIIDEFDSTADPTPTVYADLSREVYDESDRGLLGLAIDPRFTSGRPYVYALYSYDKDPNSSQVPRWGDFCPTPPGADGDGCVSSARLSRISPDGTEKVLIEDWCEQFSTHSIGSLNFGPDGALYVSGGDGASYTFADYGQKGTPVNPCGDPPAGVGGDQTPPGAEGGALRSQSFRRPAGQPVTLDGSILRVDPDTGDAMPDNPAASDPNANRRRIIAYGMRNPFRFTLRPGTDEIWFGDVGWNEWEEINRLPDHATVRDYGWPCYEGAGRMGAYDTLNLNLCESLYSAGTATGPYFTYNHGDPINGDQGCPAGTSATSGVAFYTGTQYPASYRNALFSADYARNCLMVMLKGADGLPDPSTVQVFEAGAGSPVDLEQGPDGELYYVDIAGGAVHEIAFPAGNHTPTASATATPDHGPTPLTVAFDGRGSSDPDGDGLSYSWDFDGNGTFGDATTAQATHTYTTPGKYVAQLRVTDSGGASDTVSVSITAGNPPVPAIATPSASFTWATGDTISYSGSAVDGNGVAIPASGLSWQLNIRHCARTDPNNCHTHFGTVVSGVSSGTFIAPDHDYPSHLDLILTATDSHGLTGSTTVALQPKTVDLTLDSNPAGAQLSIGADTGAGPFTERFIQNATTTITAESPQTIAGALYAFSSWSDSGAITHTITVPRTDTTYRATFERQTTVTLAGADVVGGDVSQAAPGHGEVYRTTGSTTGSATKLRLYVDDGSTANRLTLGLYDDSAGKPGALLGQATTTSIVPGAWNEVTLPSAVALTQGTAYWIGLLNPSTGTGTLKWRDDAGGAGGPEQTSPASPLLSELPAAWATGGKYTDGPVSGYALGAPGGGPTQPALSVAPTSLSFDAVAGGPNPATKPLVVSNSGGGTLNFTASDDSSWISVSPASGSAPKDVTVSIDTGGLAAGTYTGHVTIDGGSASGSPQTIPVTLNVSPAGAQTPLMGSQAIGTDVSSAPAGAAEVYKSTASSTGTATSVKVYVDAGTTAGALAAGIYSDSGGKPSALLGSGRLSAPAHDAWNEVTFTSGVPLTAGQAYWFGILNPSGSGGTLKWRDHAGGTTGGAEQTSAGRTLTDLPATWATLGSYTDGPISAYAVSSGPPPPAHLSLSASSLPFSGVSGGSSPAGKTVTVSNSGGGTLGFTVSDDQPWLSATPAGGTAPADVTVKTDTSGLAPGTYTGHVTIDAGSIAGSPATVTVTLTLSPVAPPALSVAPSSLGFTATAGGSAPPSQAVSVSNTGGGTLSFAASDDATWLSESPAGGTAPAAVNVSANPAGLSAGTYNGTVTIDAPGATGTPKTVAVTLTVSPPVTGLVGAWGFDEASGTTTADASGKGNTGTLNGATRTASGKYGNALEFNGASNWVTVPDSASLNLTTGMTVEGWVDPAAGADLWRALAVKETATGLAWGLYAFGDGGLPSGHAFTSGELWARGTSALPLNTWSHLAVTYDGTTIRLYVNGVQVGTKPQTGALVASTQPLRFGGDAIWPEWFQGRLDEIRIYNRALTAGQVQSDMGAPVTGATLMSATAVAAPLTAGAKRASRPTRRRAGVIIRRFRGTHAHGVRPRRR